MPRVWHGEYYMANTEHSRSFFRLALDGDACLLDLVSGSRSKL